MSTQYLLSKDPPSYESLYSNVPSSSITEQEDSFLSRFKRKLSRHQPFLQTLTAALFVASTVSATVMLLLWQLQNLASPQNPDDPWLFEEY